MRIIPLQTRFWQTYYVLEFWPNYDSYTSAFSIIYRIRAVHKVKDEGTNCTKLLQYNSNFKSATLNLCRHNTDESGLEDAVST